MRTTAARATATAIFAASWMLASASCSDEAPSAAASSDAAGDAGTDGTGGHGAGSRNAGGGDWGQGGGGGGGAVPCVVGSEVIAQIESYRALYDEAYQGSASDFDAMAASGIGDTYYTFQYVMDATLSMYEATRDDTYLDRALAWATTMISKATIIDASGHANWSGVWCIPSYFDVPEGGGDCPHPPIAYQLEELQGSTELARVARLVLLDPSSSPERVELAGAVRAFVAEHIVEKWGPSDRNGIAGLLANAADPTAVLSDKPMLLGRILLDLKLVSDALGALPGESEYGDWLTTIAEGFTGRLVAYDPEAAQVCPSDGVCNDAPGDDCGAQPAAPPPAATGALTWDVGIGWYNCAALDTSHANRYPYLASDLLHAGLVVQPSHVTGMARLLSRVLYNGDPDDPRIRNFIDGSQCSFYSRGPDNLGAIYAGWAALSEWDDEAFAVADAVLAALVAGKCNPTLSYNGTVYGRMELPGHLAKAARVRACR